jgi:hypothetical protein
MATRRTKRQIQADMTAEAEGALQKRPAEEIQIERAAAAPEPPAEAPMRTEIVVSVVEHGLSTGEPPIQERLEKLVAHMVKGDVLYLTVPKGSDGVELVTWLQDHFARVGPLNVGTNPQLKNNNARTREGFLCIR